MKFHTATAVLTIAISNINHIFAFTQQNSLTNPSKSFIVSSSITDRCSEKCQLHNSKLFALYSTAVETQVTENESENDTDITFNQVNKLPFRALQAHCKKRGLEAVGNTRVLRYRLLENMGLCKGEEECETLGKEDVDIDTPADVSFTNDADPDFDFNSMNNEILEKCEMGHWKSASRKIKQLRRRYVTKERPIPRETYLAVLECCSIDRLHGARAAESTRKVMEEMAELGYEIPAKLGNECVKNCLGLGSGGTHDGFGGIDPALAMLSAMQGSPDDGENSSIIESETFEAVVGALAGDDAIEEAIVLLKAMITDHSFTPPLSTFAGVAKIASSGEVQQAEMILQLLTLAKASGYILDSIGSAEAGRDLLASGVVAAEKMDNLALGLRLLTAAAKAEGCAPDRGDDLVASSSVAAQRACTVIHKKAIGKSVEDENWKLAVKLLQLMSERSLTPSNATWRKVVTLCAKQEKSKRATAILLDWVKLSKEGRAKKPPVSVFNTVTNACEICGEEELTLMVLDTMKKTHETDGNIITCNIALKRLAKLGAVTACEGIIIGMLQNGVEPNVVSYTTAIAACAMKDSMDAGSASRWVDRMKTRSTKPNFHTYNTAMAACLDGKLESTVYGSKLAADMVTEIDTEVEVGFKGEADYKSVMPDTYTKLLARKLMAQLRQNWRDGDIDMNVAKETLRVPLLKLVDFNRQKQIEDAKATAMANQNNDDEEREQITIDGEDEIEYAAINSLHKQSRRVAEI